MLYSHFYASCDCNTEVLVERSVLCIVQTSCHLTTRLLLFEVCRFFVCDQTGLVVHSYICALVRNICNFYTFDSRIIAKVLEDNKLPGAICSLVCGGADIG